MPVFETLTMQMKSTAIRMYLLSKFLINSQSRLTGQCSCPTQLHKAEVQLLKSHYSLSYIILTKTNHICIILRQLLPGKSNLQTPCSPGMVGLAPTWVILDPELDKSRTNQGMFQFRFQYILARRAKMYWNLFWKSPIIWPTFGQNLISVQCKTHCCYLRLYNLNLYRL